MITLVFTHPVKDFSDWKKEYDADEDHRKKAGINITGLFQSYDDQNMVTLIGEAPSVEAFMEFNSDPELLAAMGKAGVIGIPEIKILHKVTSE